MPISISEIMRLEHSEKPNEYIPNKYSINVLVKGWDDRNRDFQWRIACFCRNRVAGRLQIEKTRKRIHFLLKDVVISFKSTHLTFNQKVQIKAPFIKSPERHLGVVLSSTVAEDDESVCEKLGRSSKLVWSSHLSPCYRNVFIIQSVDPNKTEKDSIHYEDEFYIVTDSDKDHIPLYLEAQLRSMSSFSSVSGHSAVGFSFKATPACIWRATSSNRSEQDVTRGTPIPVNSSVLVRHLRTGLCLGVESGFFLKTFFGMEYEASAYNHLTPGFIEKAENILKLEVEPTPLKKWPPEFKN